MSEEQNQHATDVHQDRREQAQWLILLAITTGAVYLCWLMLKPFVAVLLWAAVLSLTFAPIHRRLLSRIKKPDLSAVLSVFIVIGVIGVPMGLILWAVVGEIMPATARLQTLFAELLNPQSELTGSLVRRLGQYVNVEQLRGQIMEQLGSIGSSLASSTVNILANVLGAVVQTLFVVFVMYYLLRDSAMVHGALTSAIPLRNRQVYHIFLRVREVVGASVNGVLFIAMIQGTLGGIAFAVLGVPSAIIWGIAMTFFSLIPMAGAFVVWGPAAIFLLATGSWIKALILTLWGSVVIGLVDNFLRPRLVGKRAKLHELFIFFAVLGGLQVFGILGIVLGPVVLAMTLSLFEAFRHPEELDGNPHRIIMPPGSEVDSAPDGVGLDDDGSKLVTLT